MNGLDLKSLSENPILKLINDLVMDRHDTITITFDRRLGDAEDASDNYFVDRLSILREVFEETLSAIESVTASPTNPVAASQLYRWIDTFNIGTIRETLETLDAARGQDCNPKTLLMHCYLRKVVHPKDSAFELEVSMSIVQKNSQGEPELIYPCTSTVYVLTRYDTRM